MSQPAQAQTPQTSQTTTYTIFMQIKTTPQFLALEPRERFEFLQEQILPILAANPGVQMRFYDVEFFNADVTDVVVWETTDLSQYQMVVERLRETPFWGRYFEVVSILPGIENAYANNYGVDPITRR